MQPLVQKPVEVALAAEATTGNAGVDGAPAPDKELTATQRLNELFKGNERDLERNTVAHGFDYSNPWFDA